MILKSYGITVTEAEFKNKANYLAGSGADFTYVYVIKDTLNWYLDDNGNSTRYKYTNVSSYSDEDYKNLVLTNILNSHPVQTVLKINSTAYFPYTSNGYLLSLRV